jgi:hypothetical protein
MVKGLDEIEQLRINVCLKYIQVPSCRLITVQVDYLQVQVADVLGAGSLLTGYRWQMCWVQVHYWQVTGGRCIRCRFIVDRYRFIIYLMQMANSG